MTCRKHHRCRTEVSGLHVGGQALVGW
jgi:hypothetical protein